MDVGAQLRQARERRGISLRQISTSTKISIVALEALERNDISRLPGGLFSRAFVRSYAVEVGLDPETAVQEFLAQFQHDAEATASAHLPEPPTDERAFESQQRMAGILLRLVLVSLPLAAAILYLTMREPPAAPAVAVAVAEELADATPAVAVPGDVAADPAKAWAVQRPTTIEISPTGPCWIAAHVDGRRLFSRLMQPGDREVHEIRGELTLEIGNAGSFAFRLNDRPGRSLGREGQVVTVRITPDNYQDFLR